MKGPFLVFYDALVAAEPGEEIWARNAARVADRSGWCVMTKEEADEYIRTTPFKEWSHWETIKELNHGNS